jgi:subfamily B ATP-binding cassette protein HlyB/CyaB
LQSLALGREEFVWLIGSLCQVNRVPFDAALLLQRFPAPHSVRQLLEAAKSFGFRAAEGALGSAAYPCIGFLKGADTKPVILVKADGEQVLSFAPGSQTPQTLRASDLEPRVLLIRHDKAEPLADENSAEGRRFGFRWFWSELLRHRAVWRDVLAASLFIQLIGLATPLFTQVIIDKVVVHQTSSTPIAIAVGLACSCCLTPA